MWGAKYLHTRDIGKLKFFVCMIFFLWGGTWGGHLGGGAPSICGGRPPPVATPLPTVLFCCFCRPSQNEDPTWPAAKRCNCCCYCYYCCCCCCCCCYCCWLQSFHHHPNGATLLGLEPVSIHRKARQPMQPPDQLTSPE